MSRQFATHSVDLAANADAVRTEQLNGREHVVAPVTAVQEMVLKGEFLAFEEIERTALAWNANPATTTHPTNANGEFVPASAPDQHESHVIGRLFDFEPNAEERALEGEVWLDRERSAAVAEDLGRDDPAQLLLDGETVEVSTGYWYERQETTGAHNGAEYTATQHNIQPDHLAMLPNAEGECSIEDGCGAGRSETGTNADTGATAQAYAAGADREAAHSHLKRGLSLLGLTSGCGCDGCVSDSDVSTDNDDSGHETPDETMSDRIETLAEQTAFDAEALGDMAEEQLDALEATLEGVDTETDTNSDTTEAGGADDDVTAEADADDLAEQVAAQVLDQVDERLESFEREQTEEERESLIGQIAAQTGDDPETYEDWSLDQLETFAENVSPQGGVYAGRAGAAQSTDEVEVELRGVTQAFEGGD